MELYNDVVRDLKYQERILVIDLARAMPKDSKYYYDYTHYTNEGAQKVASIIHQDLKGFLAEKYAEYLK